MNVFSKISISILVICSTAALYLLLQLTPLKAIENYYEDYIVTLASSGMPPAEEIVVIEIRESTLSLFPNRSPLDRAFLAGLVEKLIDSEAKAIGIDILLDQPSEPIKDESLKVALLKGGKTVFVPRINEESGRAGIQPSFQDEFLTDLQITSVIVAKDRSDGIVRHYLSHEISAENLRRPQLAVAMSGIDQPAGQDSFKRIFYQSNSMKFSHEFKTYPAEAAMHLPPDWFAGKFVLIGKNIDNTDQFRTPYASIAGEGVGNMPGVQVHAHILNQLLSGREIVETEWYFKLTAILLACAFGIVISLLSLEIWSRLLLVILVAAAFLVTGLFALSNTLVLLPMFAAATGLLGSFFMMSGLIWQRDRKQRQFVQTAWSRYVSKSVVDTLIENPGRLKLGGERIDASFIFTDIAGFTGLAEKLSPEALSEVINGYLDIMTEEFRTAGVTLDKIVGDAIVGFAGAPLNAADHAERVVTLALSLNDKSEQYRADMLEKGIKLGKTRIGINSGAAIIGNFGGSEFFDYTALGDAVNVAARLEAANKKTGGSICISDETVKRARARTYRPVGRLYVEGRTDAVMAWEPVQDRDNQLSGVSEYLSAYEMLDEEGGTATQKFQNLMARYPADHLVDFHLSRLKDGQTGTAIEISK
ncbi:MAG: adenylate/guanylate cyclase domain-containing protein [Pseudomonadota bacterium]